MADVITDAQLETLLPSKDDEDFVTISVKINGGRAGLDSRLRYWAKAKALFA